MSFLLWNNQYIPKEEARVSIDDRGFQFGDGVYEVIRVYCGQLFTAHEHLDRLFQSAKKIQLVLPFTPQGLLSQLETLVKKNKLDTGTVYVQVTRGVAPRSHVFPPSSVPATVFAYTNEVQRPLSLLENGVTAITTEDIRWLHCDIKSLNLLGNVLSKQRAVEAGCFEAIQVRDGMVTEGTLSNVYIVRDGAIYTHPANHLILNGITRSVVLRLAARSGIPVIETPFSKQELLTADEVFLTGTTVEVLPVTAVDQERIGNGKVGDVTKDLQSLFTMEIPRLES